MISPQLKPGVSHSIVQAGTVDAPRVSTSPDLALSLDTCRELHERTQELVRLGRALTTTAIPRAAEADTDYAARLTEEATALRALAAMAPNADKPGTDILSEAKILLQRAEQDALPLTPYENQLCGEQLEKYYQSASVEYLDLHEHTSALLETLRTNRQWLNPAEFGDTLARNLAVGFSEDGKSPPASPTPKGLRELSLSLAAFSQSDTPALPDSRPGMAKAEGGSAFTPLRYDTPVQKIAVALLALPSLAGDISHQTGSNTLQTPRASQPEKTWQSLPMWKVQEEGGHRVRRALNPVAEGLARAAVPSPQAGNDIDPGSSQVAQLKASQQEMTRLAEVIPQLTDVAKRQLDNWFSNNFPNLKDQISPQALSVNTLREEIIPQGERTPGGAATRRTVTDSVPLFTLYQLAMAGEPPPTFVMSNTDIVHDTGNGTHVILPLNNSQKYAIEKLLNDTTSQTSKRHLMDAHKAFWKAPSAFSEGQPLDEWMVNAFRQQLVAETNLRISDGTLSREMHATITNLLLSVPSAAAHADQLEAPGVYSVTDVPVEGGATGVPVLGLMVVTQRNSDADRGRAVLFQHGAALKEFDNQAELAGWLKASGFVQGEARSAPDFLTHWVADVQKSQEAAITAAWGTERKEGQAIDDWVSKIDMAADVGKTLDLTPIMEEREFLRLQKRVEVWLHSNPQVTGPDRQAWWRSMQDLRTVLTEMPSRLPDPVEQATPSAINKWARADLARLIQEKYTPADPDQVFLTIQKVKVDPTKPTGGSAYASGVWTGHDPIPFPDRRSMTEWALSNLTPAERNAPLHTVEGPLSFQEICNVIEEADVGRRFPEWLRTTSQETKAQWTDLKGKQMRAEVYAAHISGDLTKDRSNTGLNLVLAVLDSPEPAGRRKVNGHEVVARQLRFGDSVLNDIVTFGVKNLGSRPSVTLYTPGAPDGKTYRDVDANHVRDLPQAITTVFSATPEMFGWLLSKLPAAEQNAQLASLAPTPENLPLIERIKKVTQAIFTSGANSRAGAITVGSHEVKGHMLKALHETRLATAISNADTLTVSNAERNSAAAQKGRIEGLGLILGMMSMAPAGGLVGRVIGRATLPVMVGGVGVGAIKDEGGSFTQWMGDFVGGLGEVLVEAGEDLIMRGVGGHRGRVRLGEGAFPRMPDPEWSQFRVTGLDPKGLRDLGNNIYQDLQGTQQYVRNGDDFHLSDVSQGQRRVYRGSPGLVRAEERVVEREGGDWKILGRERVLGGGKRLAEVGDDGPSAPKRGDNIQQIPVTRDGAKGFDSKVIDQRSDSLPNYSRADLERPEVIEKIKRDTQERLDRLYGQDKLEIVGYHLSPEKNKEGIRASGFDIDVNTGRGAGVSGVNKNGLGMYLSTRPTLDFITADGTHTIYAVVRPKEVSWIEGSSSGNSFDATSNADLPGDFIKPSGAEIKINRRGMPRVGLMEIGETKLRDVPPIEVPKPPLPTNVDDVTVGTWASNKINDPKYSNSAEKIRSETNQFARDESILALAREMSKEYPSAKVSQLRRWLTDNVK